MAPIKRHLSRKNTPPSQKNRSLKNTLFFAGPAPVRNQPLFVACARDFVNFRCGSLNDLLPGTHQVQGRGKKKIKSTVAERRDPQYLVAQHPSFFLMAPGPIIGPQKNIGTLLCPRGCYKIQGSKSASHRGLTTRADHEKRRPPGFLLKGVQRRANQEIGFSTTTIRGIPVAVPTNEIEAPCGKELDLA